MHDLYNSLLEYYDELFPVDTVRLDFLQEHIQSVADLHTLEPGAPKILDIGCATGTGSIALMRRGFDVSGIDINTDMIQSACRRNPEPKTNARFFAMDMMEISNNFAAASFDAVLCLGNTIAHLKDLNQIKMFLTQVQELLKPGALFIFQLVNYEKVLNEKLDRLPEIRSSRARFVRKYTHCDDGYIRFETELYSSSEQVVYSDAVTLYPLTLRELKELLSGQKFGNTEIYADFEEHPCDTDSLGIVGTSNKLSMA